MKWEAAMKWARIRARETGVKRRVYGYFRWVPDPAGLRREWAYAIGYVGDPHALGYAGDPR